MTHATRRLLAPAAILCCSCVAGTRSVGDLFGSEGAQTDAGPTDDTTEPGPDDGQTQGGTQGTDGLKLDVGDGLKYDLGGGGGPVTTCAEAIEHKSYTGCEFWATITYNYVWEDYFSFAVTIANASDQPAMVEVHRAGVLVDSALVPANDLAVIELPWIAELKGSEFGSQTEFTYDAINVDVPDGAYRVTSDRPVTVYQFNALRFEALPTPPGCSDFLSPGHCYSYSNDASLLFPSHALTSNYVVTGWKHDVYGDFMSITATEDATEVHIVPSTDSNSAGWANPLTAGSDSAFMMDAGDVMAFIPNYGSGVSFSGTFVTSDKPVQVITGVPCVNIPDTSVAACDHIEETVLPVEAFGDDYLIAPPTSPMTDIHTVRILGIEDGTMLQFDPPAVHPGAAVDQGETLELSGVSTGFRVWSANASFGVTTYMHGYGQTGVGDPSQSVAVPTAQFRSSYVFLAPEDYEENYVAVTAPMGATITLDGLAIPANAFAALGGSGFGTAQELLTDIGAHYIEGDMPFGITVYGYGITTSYMYPGGMGLDLITVPPTPPAG